MCLELQPTGIRSYKDIISYVLDFRDEESPFFMALASVRKIYVEALNELGFTGMYLFSFSCCFVSPAELTCLDNSCYYVPVVCHELDNQLSGWYTHLPKTLRFPTNDTMLFDLHKSHLRCVSTLLRVMIFWPFVYRYIEEEAEIPKGVAFPAAERTEVGQRARECLRNCISYIAGSKALLMQRCLVSHVTLRGYVRIRWENVVEWLTRSRLYCVTMILLLGLQPSLKGICPEGGLNSLHDSLEVLELWSAVPMMTEPLARIHRFAQLISIPTNR